MSELFSPHWYRVRELRPALRAHLRIQRQQFRRERWYLLRDPASGRHHRLSASAYQLVAQMDGRRTLDAIFESALAVLGDETPGQSELIGLVAQLHAADALRCDVTPDAREVFERFADHRRRTRRSRLLNPLSLRFPLLDPDSWLRWLAPHVEPLFGRVGLALWSLVVCGSGLLAASHGRELSEPGLRAVLDPANLLLLALAYPVVKALHELGHGLATRCFGGEVHEMGVMFILFVPIPYVDASAAWAFPSKAQRIAVGAAGVMVELFLASLALWIWLATSPGTVRDLAWNVMLIGGVSTLFFNGNPLLRFDGYYVLADVLEIPNLAGRSAAYLASRFRSVVLGMPERGPGPLAPREAPWLVGYGVASFAYRLSVTLTIALLVARRFFVVGVLLALLGVALQTLVPLARALARLRRDAAVSRRGGRIAAGLAASATALALLLFVLPLPVRTVADAVVWPPERSQVRAEADGFVRRIRVRPGSAVAEGQALLELEDAALAARLRVLEAREREVLAQVQSARLVDPVQVEIRREDLRAVRAELERERERASGLVVRSLGAGTFVLPFAENLPGRLVHRGDVVGYVASTKAPTLRALVSQAQVARVRGETRRVEVRLRARPDAVLEARIVRQLPTASNRLPSLALGAAGGGRVAVDLHDDEGLTAVESFFQLELALAPGTELATIGGRALVRFEHPPQALAPRLFAAARRLLLGRFGV